jgi:hypothetical protein
MTRTALLRPTTQRDMLALLLCALVSIPLVLPKQQRSSNVGVRTAFQLLESKPSKEIQRAAALR